MTLVTIQRLIDKAPFAKSQAAQELSILVDYLNNAFDNLIRVTRKGIGLRDNLDCIVITTKLTHNTSSTIAVGKRPILVQIAQSTVGVTSYVWTQSTESSQISITAKFDGTPTAAVDVTLWIQYS